MPYCGERSLVKHEEGGKVLLSVRCRSWLCPDCTDQRKRQLIAQAIGGQASTFITLTTRRRDDITAQDAAKMLSRSWRLLRLRIIRMKGWKVLPFLAVMEAHKSGWPHLHVLARCGFIDWHWLKANWIEITGSPGIRIDLIKSRSQRAGYCAKYCGKAKHKIGTAKRYWQSRDYDLRPKPEQTFKAAPGEGWDPDPWSIDRLIASFKSCGWTVERPSKWKALVRAPPEWRARGGPVQ